MIEHRYEPERAHPLTSTARLDETAKCFFIRRLLGFEDFMFAIDEIADFKREAVTVNDADHLRVSIAVPRGRAFELNAQVVVLEAGTLAHDLETIKYSASPTAERRRDAHAPS